jgi:hypothetical protein
VQVDYGTLIACLGALHHSMPPNAPTSVLR